MDESAIVEIPGSVWGAVLPVVWAALGVLAVSSVLVALLHSSWAAGRRDLYHAAGGELQHYRPTDRQMRWFLRDVPPWETAAVTILAWACLGTLIGTVAALAIHFGGRAEERALGHLMLGLALISVVTIAACIHGLRGVHAAGLGSINQREKLWPLPQDSDLSEALRRSSGGASSDATVLEPTTASRPSTPLAGSAGLQAPGICGLPRMLKAVG